MNKNKKQKLPFLELTQDIVFKRFFSQNKAALISLLKNFLPLKSEIQDITILNTSKPTKNSSRFKKTENIKENNFKSPKDNKLKSQLITGLSEEEIKNMKKES